MSTKVKTRGNCRQSGLTRRREGSDSEVERQRLPSFNTGGRTRVWSMEVAEQKKGKVRGSHERRSARSRTDLMVRNRLSKGNARSGLARPTHADGVGGGGVHDRSEAGGAAVHG